MLLELNTRFFKFAALCAITTGLTTLCIHLMPNLWAEANTFEKQLALRENPLYLTRLWIVVIHCLLVVISMYGVGARRLKHAPALVSFGFLGFVVFGLIELLRTSLGIFALNRAWRARYVVATDESARALLRGTIESFAGVNDALFFLFIIAFMSGLLCYGLALWTGEGATRQVGAVFLLWFLLSVPGLLNTLFGFPQLVSWFEWVGPVFQPIARVWIGVWLWRESVTQLSPNAIAAV